MIQTPNIDASNRVCVLHTIYTIMFFILCSIICALFIFNIFGFIYFTEFIFDIKSFNDFNTWHIVMMKMSIVIYWSTLIISSMYGLNKLRKLNQ